MIELDSAPYVSLDRFLQRMGLLLDGVIDGECAALAHALTDTLDPEGRAAVLALHRHRLDRWRADALDTLRGYLLGQRPA